MHALPAHPRGPRLTYLAAAAAVFTACVAVQYLAYARLLLPGLRRPEVAEKRRALKRWFAFAVAWQAALLAAVAAYAFPISRSHPTDATWVAPAVAAILGTALPLQLAVVRIARAVVR